LALEETISELEENKVEGSEETPGDETKREESDKEMSKKEQLESTENLNSVEVNMQQLIDSIVASEKKEEFVDPENSEIPQDNTEEKKENEGINEENTENTSVAEDTEKDVSTINKEEESPGGEGVTIPFENIKIKEEPLDDIGEQPDSEIFDFANVEVKEEPMEPEPGMSALLYLLLSISHENDFVILQFLLRSRTNCERSKHGRYNICRSEKFHRWKRGIGLDTAGYSRGSIAN